MIQLPGEDALAYTRAAEARLEGSLRDQEAKAQAAASKAMADQEKLGEKLMVASGGSVGLLATLTITSSESVEPGEIVGPTIVLGVAFLMAAFGLWSRIHANLALSRHHLSFLVDLDRMKREADAQFLAGTIGKVEPPRPGPLAPFPERWMSTLDILLLAGFAVFAIGITWAGWNLFS